MKKHLDLEEVRVILDELSEMLVLVEGKRDKKALKSLGVKDIIAINGKPLYEVAEIASNSQKQIVILTDFDEKGRQMEKKLKYLLQKHGRQPDSKIRWKIMNLGKNEIEDFGTLRIPGSISPGEDDFHVKTCTDINKVHGKGRDRCAGSNREA